MALSSARRIRVARRCSSVSENRVIVLGHTDDERVVTLSEPMRSEKLKVGDHLLIVHQQDPDRIGGCHLRLHQRHGFFVTDVGVD